MTPREWLALAGGIWAGVGVFILVALGAHSRTARELRYAVHVALLWPWIVTRLSR